MKRLLTVLFLFISSTLLSQPKLGKLTVEKIMRDAKWMGSSPANPVWSYDGNYLYFNWNPDKTDADSLYYITRDNKTPVKASAEQRQNMLSQTAVTYNKART